MSYNNLSPTPKTSVTVPDFAAIPNPALSNGVIDNLSEESIDKFGTGIIDSEVANKRHKRIIPRRAGVLYLTDNELPDKMWLLCGETLLQAIGDLELVSSSRKAMDFGKNVVTDLPRGYECYFKQILKGLEALTSDLVFIAEHDVLYPAEHFQFDPPDDKIYYDVNWWKVHSDGLAVSWKADQVSGICAPREVLLKWYGSRVASFDPKTFDRKFEPQSGEGSEQWQASRPHIDIRHGRNLTMNKRGLHHFRKKETAVDFQESTISQIPGWELMLDQIY